jgi:endonuclease/exonuclease/phosphatase family metal-dependent hydrolase
MRRLTLGVVALALVVPAAATIHEGSATISGGASATKPLRVATLNVLHGQFCPAETDFCHAADRADLVARALEAAGCPQLVGLQEVGLRQEDEVPRAVDDVCGGRYKIAWQSVDSPDREMVLTTLPIRDRGYLDITNFPWEAYWVRVKTVLGPVEFLTTHFAASVNNPLCTPEICPPVCPAGITTNHCHAIEVVDFFAARPDARLQIVAGDLNAFGGPTLATFTDAGFADAWLEAGRAECDQETSRGCTGGRPRPANPLDGLDVSDGRYTVRLDYVLVRSTRDCKLRVRVEPLLAEPLERPYRGLYWASDHAGVVADLRCVPSR